MTIRKKDLRAIVEMTCILIFFVFITYFATFGTIGMILSVLLFFSILYFFVYKIQNGYEISTLIATPIMLSAFQNVYMGIFSMELTSSGVQLITIFNFLVASLILLILLVGKSRFLRKNKLYVAFLLLIMYSFISVIFLNNINVISILSSLRNIISVFIFFFIGMLISEKVDMDKFQRIILFIALIVIIAGFIDVASKGEMWRNLNITELWTKKGIRLKSDGIPTNFYSSETINGQRIRRMASTFADPVNLGAFLFAIFSISWYRKNTIMTFLSIVAIVLTVSKGALLGLLIFMCVYACYFFSKSTFITILGASGVCGVAFLAYASRTSANSVFVHIMGLLAAFKSIIKMPLGSGIGSNGVLAKQFSGLSSNSDITETGMGMIIAQLGVVGLFLYTFFFVRITKESLRIENIRQRVLCTTLLLAVIANIFFNEVALSPNSCALYFIITGYYIREYRGKKYER